MKKEKLDSQIKILSGFPFRSNLFNQNKEGLPIIRVRDVNSGFAGVFYSGDYSDDYLIENGDILISMDGDFRCIEWQAGPALLNQRVCKIIPNPKELYTKYLIHFLPQALSEIHSKTIYTTVKHLSTKTIRDIEIPLPNLEDQIRIATLLSRVEALIATRKENLHLLNVFLKSTFLEMFGIQNGKFKEWKIEKLNRYTDIVSGVTKGKKYKKETLVEVPYMRVANVQDGFLDLKDIKTIMVSPNEIEKYKLKQDDVLLTEGGDPDKLGRGFVWEGQIEECIHQNHIFRVRVLNLGEINPYYLSGLVGSLYGKSYFLKAAKQTTGIASINSTQLKNFPLIIAPIDLQNNYAEIAAKTENVKAHYEQNLTGLENLYGALSQKAFKGKLDLSRIPVKQGLDLQIDVNERVSVSEALTFGPLDQGAMSDPAARERLLQGIVEKYFSGQPNRTFSFKDFWPRIEFKVQDYMDDESPPLGMADYNLIKEWVFEKLKNEQIEQHFNEDENRMELRTKQ